MVFVEVDVGVTSWVGKLLLVEVVVLVEVFDAVDVVNLLDHLHSDF